MKTSVRNFLITFVAALLVFGVAAYFISSFVTKTITDSIDGEQAVSFEILTETSDDPKSDNEVDDIFDKLEGESFNLVIIGTDYQPGVLDDYDVESKYEGFPQERDREYRADAVAIVRFSKETKKLLITTVPTTMKLEAGGLVTTLGDIYREYGVDYFMNKLTALTGLELTKYFIIDIKNLAPLINTVGGISFYVPEKMSYSDPEQELTIELERGETYIDGKKAEQLLRYNGYTDPSNSRAKTTAEFIKAYADKLADASYMEKASSLYSAFTKYLKTNYTSDDLVTNLELITHYADFEKVTMVYPGKYITVGGDTHFDPDIQSAISTYSEYK